MRSNKKGIVGTAITNTSKESRDPAMYVGRERDTKERTRWEKATIAYTMLKAKIATTPILKHFVPDRILVIAAYAARGRCQHHSCKNTTGCIGR